MPTHRSLRTLALALALLPETAAALPPDFQDALVTTVGSPTALAFTPDGRLLIARQGGQLRVYQGGALLATPALTVTPVCTSSEQGLLGIAVDPDFATNNYVYLYYTVNKGTCYNRVSRFVLPATNVISSASEVVLLDNLRATAGNHNGGDLNFGKDGLLYVSVGDGGCDYLAPFGCAGSNQAARQVNVLNGKILRITRDGGVPPDNPWLGAGTASCKTADAPNGVRCQETFAWGLRNPFRFAMDPGALGTRFFINDVGQGAWEEIDLGQKGVDYGWNCREGAHTNSTSGKCAPTPPAMVDPLYEYSHGTGCGSITGGAFVPKGFWPATHDGSYFYSDYNCGQVFELKQSGAVYTASSFHTGPGSAVHLEFGPYGAGIGLYYTNYAGGGQIRVIHYTGTGNRAPTAVMGATPLAGPPPLAVTFSGLGSSDPDGDALSYVWTFGDGSPDTETTTVGTTHSYATSGSFTAVLRAKDTSAVLSDPVAVILNVGNTAPVPTILAPAVSAHFRVGQLVTLQGSATDAEDGALPDAQLTWNVLLHHDAHTHPFLTDVVGNNVGLTAPAPEDAFAAETSYLEIRLSARDAFGATATVTQDFQPNKVALSFATTPSGLGLEVNGQTFTAPFTFTSWEAWDLSLNAPDQLLGATSYTFLAWSDEGTQAHTFTTPAAAASLGASYGANAPPPQATPFLVVTSTNQANKLQWVNPTDPAFVSTTLVFRTNRFPTTPLDGTPVFTGGAAGDRSVFDHLALTNGVTYYYAAFVNLSGGGVSAGRLARGRPFDNLTGAAKWAYTTGATTMAPPGIGSSVIVASNDRVVHSLIRGPSGGAWPASFTPVVLGGVAQSRPPVLMAGVLPGQPSLALLAAQDGVAYLVDAETGAPVNQSLVLGETLQGALAGGFTAYGFPFDRLFVGTRNSSSANAFYGLDPATLTPVGAPYAGTEGGGLGIVSGGAAVDYATGRVYFASRAAAPGSHTLWCLDATPSGFAYQWSKDIGNVDGSPVLRGDRVYVAGNDGVVHALDKATGTEHWAFDTGSQPIKGFLFPDRSGGPGLYFATTNSVHGLADNGTSAANLFTPVAVPSPSIVLFRPAEGAQPPRLYFGAGNQRLYELDLSSPTPTQKSVLLGGTPAVIGAPTYDQEHGLIYVGSDAGVVYAVPAPLL